MKLMRQISAITSLVISGSAFSLEPINGFYVGVAAAVASGPSTYTRTFAGILPDGQVVAASGTVNNNLIGGGIGGEIGFRYAPFRVEGELYYNYNGTKTLNTTSCTLESPGTPPTGNCSLSLINDLQLGFNGSTGVTYGFFNFYYDFFSASYDGEGQFVPYLGIGAGMANVKTGVNFVSPTLNQSVGGSKQVNVPAAQFIVGVSYFMDDFAWIQADYRYTTTNNISQANQTLVKPNIVIIDTQGSTRYALNTLMFSINFSFDNKWLNMPS